VEHECKYCGATNEEPDYKCYKRPPILDKIYKHLTINLDCLTDGNKWALAEELTDLIQANSFYVPVDPEVTKTVKEIMQEGFEIAMGGSVDLSEEANRKEQTARYDRAVKNYSTIINGWVKQAKLDSMNEMPHIVKITK